MLFLNLNLKTFSTTNLQFLMGWRNGLVELNIPMGIHYLQGNLAAWIYLTLSQHQSLLVIPLESSRQNSYLQRTGEYKFLLVSQYCL